MMMLGEEEEMYCLCQWYCSCKSVIKKRSLQGIFNTAEYQHFMKKQKGRGEEGSIKIKDQKKDESLAKKKSDLFKEPLPFPSVVNKSQEVEFKKSRKITTDETDKVTPPPSSNSNSSYNCRNRSSFHKCIQCGKLFGQLSSLHWHQKEHDLQEPVNFKCHQCGKTYTTAVTYEKHMKLHPKCGMCGGSVDKGKEVFDEDGTLFCKKCKGGGDSSIRRTSQVSSDEDFSLRDKENQTTDLCDFCGLMFDDSSNFTAHYDLHGRNYSHGSFECRYCFAQQSGTEEEARAHEETHNSDRSFPCLLCPLRFKDVGAKTFHEKIHKKETPFPCITCGQPFMEENRLLKHSKAIHNVVIEAKRKNL